MKETDKLTTKAGKDLATVAHTVVNTYFPVHPKFVDKAIDKIGAFAGKQLDHALKAVEKVVVTKVEHAVKNLVKHLFHHHSKKKHA